MPYARGYRVQLSMDGSTWSDPVAEGQGIGPSTVITFTPARTRFVRIFPNAASCLRLASALCVETHGKLV